ncbi:MAG: glycine--tRNA ligase [Candidatus Omnitrophica bacterium]|nr:glycine--tRNA ligase [Candidatus Omnitrophota bacterium]
MHDNLMDKIVSLCKRRGFIFQGSEIYGGLANTWDYGPLGAELKRNIKDAWWRANVYERGDMVGLDAAILMHPKVWEASGHTQNFSDLAVDCKNCKKRWRADQIKGECPECGSRGLTDARAFNLMFKTFQGPIEDEANLVYLRPETAQGIFVNFPNVLDTARKKLPFGIAQTGKAFRNEITPGNLTFRTREFEQMEIEYFVRPEEAAKYYDYWVNERFNWYTGLGLKKENLRVRPHSKDELAHYARSCSDIEYQFPFGWSELEGIANRGDFDLVQHSKVSGKEMAYFDDTTKEKFTPYIIEPSGGVDRAALAFLVDAYYEEKVKGETRAVLKFSKALAPVKAAVLPLLKNRPEIVELARKTYEGLRKNLACVYDDTAAIGKLYRRQDEVGTLYCVTVDVQSLEDRQVTVRDRDTMKQDRIPLETLEKYFGEKLR